VHDFMAERTEDDQSELDIYIHEAGAMADETFGSGEEVIETYAEANFLDDLVAVSAFPVLFETIRCSDLTLFAYLALILSSMACLLGFEKS